MPRLGMAAIEWSRVCLVTSSNQFCHGQGKQSVWHVEMCEAGGYGFVKSGSRGCGALSCLCQKAWHLGTMSFKQGDCGVGTAVGNSMNSWNRLKRAERKRVNGSRWLLREKHQTFWQVLMCAWCVSLCTSPFISQMTDVEEEKIYLRTVR